MFCHKCGTQIAEGAAFCHKCGTKVVYVDTAPLSIDTPVPARKPIAASSPTVVTPANPAPRAATITIKANVPINASGNGRNDFKAFVDNHVRATTSFKSAEELLNSKPMKFAWIIVGVLSFLGVVLGAVRIGGIRGALVGLFVLGAFFGYAVVFIVSGIIRSRYGLKYSGKLDRIIDLDDFGIFLNSHLKSVSPYFHECGYLTNRGGLLATIENKFANALQKVTLCSVFGDSEAYMATIAFRPDTATPDSKGMWYTVGAVRRGFMIDGRGASFLGHSCLIRTAPIMQAAVLYYINNQECGVKLMDDTSAAQPADTPAAEGNAESHVNDADIENSGLRKMKTLGRVLWYGALLALLLLSFFNLPINPVVLVAIAGIGLILISLGPKRPFSQPNIVELAIGVILLVAAVVGILLSVRTSDKYVQMVKSGTLNEYPQMTVGKAFDNFLDDPRWESGLSDDDVRFVNVKGRILYYNEEAELLVQFIIVDEKDKSFQYNACEINGVPQANLIFWGLLEAIYNGDSAYIGTTASKGLGSQDEPDFISDINDIGKTQSYDNEFGNIEVTLDYVEFMDKIENTWFGGYKYPDDGCVFLWAAITVKNIGTKYGDLLVAWNTIVYDDIYEFRSYSTEGEPLTGIAPLTPPIEGAIIFEVPIEVMESDKSLVLNFGDGSGSAALSYVIRPDRSTNNVSSASTGKLESGSSHKAAEGFCYKGIPVDQLFGKSQDDIISILGEPEPSILGDFIYGDVSMTFDTWSLPEPYLELIFGGPFEDFSYNGQPFTEDDQRIIEIMGRDPDSSDLSYPGQEFGLYSISYSLDCLGSTVYLEFLFPADEYSTQPTSIYVYWWNPDAADQGVPGVDFPSED